ncbi:aldehyde dehydrogenase family protein [Aquisediminimonas profunda]|uniref:aldehyde dehydrogenase family protein n=1 Tax=Aquisediminimonas profunda TaxID=1550733 RepID=UPI001C63A30A|nr:aldehyde dehydrogenase family protein [Aquisediminimonas profunda]
MDFENSYQMLINGKLVSTPTNFEVLNPATEEVIARAPCATRDLLRDAVTAARNAFPIWRDTPIAERQRVVRQIGTAIETNADALKRLLTLEQGKARAGADWEIDGSAAWCAAISEQSLTPEIIENEKNHFVETRRVPLGVIGAITPWNFPVLLAIWKIAPALLTGNTMILKPSPFTPLTSLKLGELVQSIVPPGVLNVLSGGDELGSWISSHPDIDKISFTGSTSTGKKIVQAASNTLKRVTLELGGNDPAIVMPDVDPTAIAKELFWAAFQNSAQFCVAAKRIYIHEDIYDAVRDELVTYAKTIKIGNGSHQGTELGPIQNRMQYEKLKDLIADIKSNGSKIALGGDVPVGQGYFVPITIVDDPSEDSRIVKEEAFGPILPLLKFNDINDVIARANDTHYGLAASVWSNDLALARKVAERIEAGTVWINEVHVFGPHIAFGGHKQSGIGVENAREGLAEYTNSQTIMQRQLI